LLVRSEGSLMRLDGCLTEGQGVRILLGPFADFVRTLKRLDGSGRVQVLLNLMGSSVPISLHRSSPTPAA
ncbi:hypothetical protein NL533_33465, partial [Klebsiella pneumoniae]|nr:hypothetical protein [Klebsiella pneumoniae]